MKRLVTVAVLLGVACGCGQRGVNELAHAPDFRLETLDHERFYLNAQHGQSVVLVFWATWCVPCKRELVELTKLARAFEGRPVVFATVLTDSENVDRARGLARDLKVSLPILVDTGSEVARRYGADPIPLTVAVDAEGRLAFERHGYTPTLMQDLRTCVERLLEAQGHEG